MPRNSSLSEEFSVIFITHNDFFFTMTLMNKIYFLFSLYKKNLILFLLCEF